MKCAISYQKKINEAKKGRIANVLNGTLKKIVNEEEKKAGLSVYTISLDTVRSRVKRGNLSAYNENQQSPILDIEALICEFCICLGKMGGPLTKTTVIELINGLASGTDLEQKIVVCKIRKLNCIEKLGTAWYKGFLHHYKHVLTRKGFIVKFKMKNMGKVESFQNMYGNVYEMMVEAGIAEVVEEAIQHEAGL
jgi:hypothetical protein